VLRRSDIRHAIAAVQVRQGQTTCGYNNSSYHKHGTSTVVKPDVVNKGDMHLRAQYQDRNTTQQKHGYMDISKAIAHRYTHVTCVMNTMTTTYWNK
jgi:hypothetical protein